MSRRKKNKVVDTGKDRHRNYAEEIYFSQKNELVWICDASRGFRAGVGKIFSRRAAATNFKLLRAAQYAAKAVSKLDCHAIKMKNMLKSLENIIHPQYGNALHVYNAFIRYQVIRK